MEAGPTKRYFNMESGPLSVGRNIDYSAHMDVGTQANIRTPRPEFGASYSDDEYTSSNSRSRVMSAVFDSGRRYLSRVTSARCNEPQHYSRQDIMEQYCVTPHQLRTLDCLAASAVNNHHGGSLFGCLSSNNHQGSVCNRASFLSSCVGRQSTAAEDMAQYWPQKPPRSAHLPPPPPPPSTGTTPYTTYQMGRQRGRYEWVPEEAEEAYHSLERPRPIPLTGFSAKEFARAGTEGEASRRGAARGQQLSISEDQLRQAEARMRGHNHTEPNTPLSSRRGQGMGLEEGRRGSKHVSFMESRGGALVRSQTTSSFEEAAHAGGYTGVGARWRLAAARSQERLLDGAVTKTKKQPAPEEEQPHANKALIMEKIKRATMKTQATQTDLPVPASVVKPPRDRAPRETSWHGYLSLSPRSLQRSNHIPHTKLMKSYSASAGGSTAPHSHASDISGSISGWENLNDSEDDEDEHQDEEHEKENMRPMVQRSHSAQPSRTNQCHGEKKRDLSPRYKEIFIDFEPNVSPQNSQASPNGTRKRPLHKTLSEGEILSERRRIQKSDYLERQSEAAATVEDADLYSRHFDPASPNASPLASVAHIPTEGTNGSLFSSSSLLDEEEFHENLLMREGLFCKRRLSLDDRTGRSESDFSEDKTVDETEGRPHSQPGPRVSPQGLLLLPSDKRKQGGSSCDSISITNLNNSQGSQQNTWCESQATVIAMTASDSENLASLSEQSSGSAQRRAMLLLAHQAQRSSIDTEGLTEEEDTLKAHPEPQAPRKSPSPQPSRTSNVTSPNPPPLRSPYTSPPLLHPSPRLSCHGNDISETSEDYVTATDNSAATDSSSLRRRKQLCLNSDMHAPVATSSSTVGEGGSSFESASSMQSGARDETAQTEQLREVSPVTPKPEMEIIEVIVERKSAGEATPSSPSAASSSSSGSYSLQGSSADLEHGAVVTDEPRPPLPPPKPEKLQTMMSKPPVEHIHLSKQQVLPMLPDITPDSKSRVGWNEEERSKAKRGFKLDFSPSPTATPGQEGREGSPSTQTKPPRKKQHRHVEAAGEQVTPGMVRSPAMHQGFRPEDWVVHRMSPSAAGAQTTGVLPGPDKISPQSTLVGSSGLSPGSRRVQQPRRDSSSSSEDEAIRRTPSPAARSPTNCKTLPRASPRRRGTNTAARSPTATLQRPRRRSASEDLKILSSSQTALPSVTYTASSVRRKSAPRIHQPPSPSRDADGKILQPGMLLSPHQPHHKSHSGGRKANSNKTSPDHINKPGMKALSAESLRSVSPGSDSVFYDPCSSASPSKADHAKQQAAETSTSESFIVQPPAGFADSPEAPSSKNKSQTSAQGRLYKKQDKRRFKSEERGEKGTCVHHHSKEGNPRRHQHRVCRHANPRAKSEERRQHSDKPEGSRVTSSRSAQSSLELLRASGSSPNISMDQPGEEESGIYCEAFRSGCWVYISAREERLVWRSSTGTVSTPVGTPPSSPDSSTASERDFRRRYQAVTHRMVHRRASAEMFTRLTTHSFESDQTVTVRRGDGEFGFRIHGSRPVVVSAIEPATPAETSGLEVGDIVISVNGVNVLDASHSEVVKIAHAGSEVLELEIASTRHILTPSDIGDDMADDGPSATVERCGHLMKRSSASSKWMRRWFVLRGDGCLYCYKTPTLECRPLGALCLTQYSVSAPDPGSLSDPVTEPRWTLKLHREGALVLTLAADSQAERDDWMSTMQVAADNPIKWEERLAHGGRLTLTPADIVNPDCFGYLNKLGRRWRAWTRLYCVLKDACLFLFPTPESPRAAGLLCLHGYRIQSASAGGKRFAFDALAPDPKQRHYYFHTDSELDKKRWMAALEYSVDRWLKVA